MRKNLLKILTVAALAFGAGACTPKSNNTSTSDTELPPSTEPSTGPVEEEVLEVTAEEVIEIADDEAHDFVLVGKKVHVPSIALQGKYGNVFIGAVSWGNYVYQLGGIEIQMEGEVPTFEKGSGWGAELDVVGRVTNINGRVALTEATVTVVSEREYNDAHTSYTGGLPISYCPGQYTSRSLWDGYLGRANSGGYYQGYFQLASLPEGPLADEDLSFQVVFPGEDTDATDLENLSLITVQAPASVAAASKEVFNSFFFTEGSEKQVGDYVLIDSVTQYDLEANGGLGYVLDTWGMSSLADVPASAKPVIATQWSQVAAHYQPSFQDAFLDLSPADDQDALGLPFSYVLDDSYVDGDPRDPWADAYKDQIVKLTNPEKCATAAVTVNFKPANFEAYTDRLVEKLQALGYTLDSSLANNGVYLMLKQSGEDVVAEVVISLESESSLTLYISAPHFQIEEDYATFAELKAAYESRAVAKLSALAEATAAFTSALPAPSGDVLPESFNLSWKYESSYDKYYATYGAMVAYTITLGYADSVTAQQLQAAGYAYMVAGAAAGFEEASFTLFGIAGYYNETSREFVELSLDAENKALVAEVTILDADTATYVAFPATNDAEMLAQINAEYAGWHGASATYFPTTATSLTGFTIGTQAPVAYGLLDMQYDECTEGTGYTPYFSFILEYENALQAADVQAFVANLTGFVPAEHAVFGGGLWNASTCEFIIIQYQGNQLYIGIGLVHSGAVSMVITVATE